MVAYLEKSDNNTEFHQIVDFLSSCSINYALTAIVISESSVRSDLLFEGEDGITCLTNDDIFENLALMGYEPFFAKLTFQKGGDSVERAITTDASLEASQASDNILKTQTTAMPNVDIPRGMDTGGSPRHQETMRGTSAQTSGEGRMEHTIELTDTVPPTPYDSPLIRCYTPRSDEERMIEELDKDEDVNLVSQQGEVQEITEPLKDDDDATLAKTLLNIKRNKCDQAQKIDWNDPKVLRYHALQNRPFSKAEVRKNMVMYLKNQGGYKQSYFKGMKYEDIRPIFERVWDQVHTFVPKDLKIKKEVMKRSRFHLQQESSKKQKLDQQTEEKGEEVKAQADSDQEVEEMKLYTRIVPDEDIAIDVIPLANKPLVIVEYKIVKEGKISTYHIIKADGSTKRYTSMINLLKSIDREDLEALWKLIKDKHGNTRQEEGYERVLWGDLKVMFEPA
nr:hypothetical protein [Tanacetum cinerariifolium]